MSDWFDEAAVNANDFIERLERSGHFKRLEEYCESLVETQRRCGERLGHIFGSKGWCLNCGWPEDES